MTLTQPFSNALATVGSNPLHMQVRINATDPTVWAEISTANGLITVSGGGTSISINIPQSKLVTIPPGAYVYSIIMSAFGGTSRVEVARGDLTHNAGPTQWDAGTP
jgi:hypothetical protein